MIADVGVQRRHRGQPLAGERALDRGDRAGVLWEVGADVAAEHAERETRRAGHVAHRHPGVAVLFDLERRRPAVLDCVAEAVERTDAGIAAPREHELAGAAGSDQLVVDEIGRHPHQRQVTPALADDLVARRVRDEVGEALEGDGVAVVDVGRDGAGERLDRCHSELHRINARLPGADELGQFR